MPPWQGILFDLDDTLYPEREYVLSGFRAVARWADLHLGIAMTEGYAQLCELYSRGVRGHTMNVWLRQRGVSDGTVVPELVEAYRRHVPEVAPFRQMPGLLGRLGQKYKLALVSDGYLQVQQRKLDALGLRPFFDCIVFSDQWSRAAWKPSTRPFEAALDALSLSDSPSSAIYVADNPVKDFLGARRMGIFTVRCLWAGGEYFALDAPTAQHAAHRTVATISELEQMLDSSEASVAG